PRQGAAIAATADHSEPHVIEPALGIVETEQQRCDIAAVSPVAETADNAIGGSQPLYLQHRSLARNVGSVETLGDDAVDRAATVGEPLLRRRKVAGEGGQPKPALSADRLMKLFEMRAALGERPVNHVLAAARDQHVERDEDGRRFGSES